MAWVYVAEIAVDQAFGLITAAIFAVILLFSFTTPYLIPVWALLARSSSSDYSAS